MKNFCIALVLLLVGVTGCATTNVGGTGTAAVQPSVFCQVRNPPNPLLLGSWECYFVRGGENNYVRITVTKFGHKYGLYENRIFAHGKKRRFGWKDWIISGNEILGVPQKYGVRMFVQDHNVYFTIRGLEHPVRMKRVK